MSASAGRRDPFLGLVLDGKYEVVAAIARGGMGRVYRAIQRPLGREVALKILDLEELDPKKGGGSDFAKRFFLEAASGAQLNHPNTVVVYDYGQAEDDIFYIAMELLAGQTLDDLLEAEAPLDPARVKHIALQVCGSIGQAHEQGMVHRDLKPSNVMLTSRGADPDFVKVLDFGLVKQGGVESGLTQSGALLGTPRYIAPEQISSSDVGPESDIYSLGACLYHCLTGRPPFESDSKFVLLASHMNVEAPDIHVAYPESPASPELAAIVMRCLRKDPTMRYRSMGELVEALLATPEPNLSGRASLPSKSSPGTSSPSGSKPGVTRPESALDRSGIKRSNADVLMTSVARPSAITSRAIAPTEAAASMPAAPASSRVALFAGAGIAGALLVGLGFWAFAGEAPAAEAPAPDVVGAQADEAAEPSTSGEPSTTAAPSEPDVRAATEISPVRLVVSPDGARVRRGDQLLGDAPITLPVPTGESWRLVVEADGYQPREVTVLAGQGEVSVALDRQEQRRVTMRGERASTPMAEAPEPVVAPSVMEAPTVMEAAPAMTPTVRTDNRDPWAR